jgi:hypothetical protein
MLGFLNKIVHVSSVLARILDSLTDILNPRRRRRREITHTYTKREVNNGKEVRKKE